MTDTDSLVVGGGFHGSMIACRLAARGRRVLLIEKEPDLLLRASFANQARLHLGYTQSIDAAWRLRHNLGRFLNEFRRCCQSHRQTFYAIGRSTPKLTPGQFHAFHHHLGIPIEEAVESIRRLFDPAHIETVFRVHEAIVDAVELRREMWRRIGQSGVQVALATQVEQIQARPGGRLRVRVREGERERVLEVSQVFNCAYSQLNALLHRSQLRPLPLRYELMELALVDVPGGLRNQGVTILSGPFFSLMPFPSTPFHTLSHVRFSPHAAWNELGRDAPSPQEILTEVSRQTGFERMRREASRYMPSLSELRYQRSLWELKAANETDPDAPAVLWPHCGARNLHCVLGTRLDGIYDLLESVDRLVPTQPSSLAA